MGDRPVPKRAFRLPQILSQEEVERLIQCAGSPLHRIWLLTLYATGIRREELVQLQIGDIDSDRMLIRIRQGKGKKDRNVMLSPRLLQELRGYWPAANPKPKTYLFPSQGTHPNGDLPMTSKVHPHTPDIASLPTYWNPAQICARFNSCSATPI